MEEKYIKQIEHNGYVANIILRKEFNMESSNLYKIFIDDKNTSHSYSSYVVSDKHLKQMEIFSNELEQTFKSVIDKIKPNFETIIENLGFVKQNNR